MLASKEVSKRNVISAAKIYFARETTRFFTGEWGRGWGVTYSLGTPLYDNNSYDVTQSHKCSTCSLNKRLQKRNDKI